MNMVLRSIFVLGMALAVSAQGVMAAPRKVASLPASVDVTNVRAGDTTGQLVVPLDKSQLLHIDQPFREISVGNKDIADVLPLSRNLIYVLGKKYGTTNLTIRSPGGGIIAVVDVVVTFDIDGLKRRLHELMPDENIRIVPTGDAISLEGTVSSADHLRQILTIADHYAPGKVANVMSLAGSQQVLLQVKFAEVSRSVLENLEVNSSISSTLGNPNNVFKLGGGPDFSTNNSLFSPGGTLLNPQEAYGAAIGKVITGNYLLESALGALEKKGLVRTLAEPNLVSLSGDTASFLAGGEFPIPVAQSTVGTTPTASVEFKDFGVSLAFTPTIIGKELVNLVLRSEVSSLDNSLSTTANGFSIPALKVRRAKTTVELKDGQSFAIAGLLQDDFQNGTSGYPFLGNLPVLGALFRSPSYQHQQTDLLMIVTVHIVAPTVASNLKTPIDNLVLPTPLEHFGEGKLEATPQGKVPDSAPDKNNQGYVLP